MNICGARCFLELAPNFDLRHSTLEFVVCNIYMLKFLKKEFQRDDITHPEECDAG